MSPIIEFDVTMIRPERDAVYRNQGVRDDAIVPEMIQELHSKATEIFSTAAEPVGIVSELSIGEFEPVFRGEGKNEKNTPLEHIFPRADQLALFALTMGHEVSSEIEELFDEKEFVLGAMLDAVASLATDKAAEVLEANMQRDFLERGLIADDHVVLSYSPGYCGWHLSGQKKLFEYLEPERIQVTLNDSFLMSPLKSVSGVLVAGEVGVHLFDNNFPFCRECKTRSCRLRMSRLSVGRTP